MTEEEQEYCQVYCKGFRDTGGKCFVDGRCDAFIQYFQKREKEMTQEQTKCYDVDQCTHKKWNQDKHCWERFFNDCMFCSFLCQQRIEDFKREGKKQYIDKTTGFIYFK